jgi:CO dehydrogenase maturation factor
MLENGDRVTIIDMEAGLEHLSRATGRHVDTLLVTLEPYYKALETSRRCAELGRELGIPHVYGVPNKIHDSTDSAAVTAFAAAHQIPLLTTIPFDDAVRRADIAGTPLADVAGSPALAAINRLATELLD